MAAQLDPSTVPVVSELVAAVPLDDELNVYDAGSGRTLVLNSSAAQVFGLADGGRTVADIAAHLARAYAADGDVVRRDVLAAVERLVGEGLLRIATAQPA